MELPGNYQFKDTLNTFIRPWATNSLVPKNDVSTNASSHLTASVEEKALTLLPVVSNQYLPGGTNETRLIRLEDGSMAVFKPGEGERRLELTESWNTLYKRERAAYLVDRALGFDLVPTTVLRQIDKREGSLQEFVPDPIHYLWHVSDRESIGEQLYTLSLFDYLIWNKDRKEQNLLIKAGKIRAIDNGLSFDNWWERLISRNLSAYVIERHAPKSVAEKIQQFQDSPQIKQSLQEILLELIPSQCISALFTRIAYICTLIETNGKMQYSDNFGYLPKR